jgi:hypothetical protein
VRATVKLRWRLRWWLVERREACVALYCRLTGHRVFPECDLLYCTRCHQWSDDGGETWD